ncbi:hypothetical protein HAX54_010343 [Datura stramonium]|uniref:Protein kinase domain-containing protein n=1 Tax=Datura stramonium TaxID=4076 RepID=A0ABS8TH37_DATST|nr:hypothetical protein [Datura stramonium]
MLIYEYMPNKSLDYYIYNQERRLVLNWEKKVQIIEGIIQGLLYLQEYSRLTIIHRDIKASNILLDIQMKPKISDFRMARIFKKDEVEANTSKIVGTWCMQIALLCVQKNPLDRPTMLQVSSMFKNFANLAMDSPKRPAFSVREDEKQSDSLMKFGSVQEIETATITQLIAR